MSHRYILPTPVEILREIAGCLNVKNTRDNKDLDDKAQEPIMHPVQLTALINKVLLAPISRNGSASFSTFIVQAAESIIGTYCRKMAGCGFFIGSNRAQALITLNRHFFPVLLEAVLSKVVVQYKGLTLHELLSDKPAFDVVWRWCFETVPSWQQFKNASKEQKDQIQNWRNGKHLPTIGALKILVPDDARELIFPLLLTARFIDALKQKSWGKRLIDGVLYIGAYSDLSEHKNSDLKSAVNKHTERYFSRFAAFRSEISALEKLLVCRDKSVTDLEQAVMQLQACKNMDTTLVPANGAGLMSWFEARFMVQGYGHLDRAKALYELAFNSLLCCGGNYIGEVINEALVVTSVSKAPDRVFLKKLKAAQILFGYDIQSAELSPNQQRQRFEDTIESWEVDMWRKGFEKLFAPHTLFPGVEYPHADNRGPLCFNTGNEIKPDLRDPDRKIKVGESWKMRMPQLNYFLMTSNYEAVKALIERGASVNISSEVGDTPLLLALGALNLLDVPYASLDRRFYDLIVSQPVKTEFVKTRTLKKRLLPLIQAVRTGKFDIVQKVLELGADVHQRGLTDNQTALNQIIKMIGCFKSPEEFRRVMAKHPITPELLDTIRRHSAGDAGFTLSDAEHTISNTKNHPFYKIFSDIAFDLMRSRLRTNTSLEELRQIATLLITERADVNAEHNSPVKGYTPLMLAAELNEGELFALMLKHGGQPHKTYIDPNTRTTQNAWQIATFWRAYSVLALQP